MGAGFRGTRAAAILTLALLGSGAWAEPYLAVREGLTCGACHVNVTGAGLRTTFGNAYAHQRLPVHGQAPAEEQADEPPGRTVGFDGRLALGANARASARQRERSDQDDNLSFAVDRVSLYLGADLGRAYLYVDQQVAPGGSLNREAWVKLQWGEWYAKAGRMFLPFGWRLEDDSALVRQATGINMIQGDDGVEVGVERPGFAWQLAVTNGNGGGPEVDDGKSFSTRAALIRSRWQAGVSAYHNDTDVGDRRMAGVFLGLRTGPVAWLAEYDRIEDEDAADGAADSEEGAGLLEANVWLRPGHNLKFVAEARTFEEQEDAYRFGAVYEYFPWPFAQLRLGARTRESDADDPALNSEELFLQLHAFF